MGRTTYGVKAATLEDGDQVVSLVAVRREGTLLTVTENGFGKRSEIGEYRVSHRGGLGIITIKTTERNGNVVAVKEVVDGEELMVIKRQGQVIRMPVSGVSLIGRNTQGVKMVQLEEGDQVTDVTRVIGEEAGEAEGGAAEGAPSGNGNTPDDEADEAEE